MTTQRILVVDDHPLFRAALRHAIATALAPTRIEEAGTLDIARDALAADEFDLVLLDLKMPGVQGLSGLIYLRSEFPDTPVVVVSASEEPRIMRRAIDLGASGFIPKSASAEVLRQALQAILAGELWVPEEARTLPPDDRRTAALARKMATLTPQQMRVLMMLREGLLNKQIAFQLGVAEATVKAHVSSVLQKLGVDSRTQAVIAATQIDGEMETGLAGLG
jgi:DNA-binding NarL/FixJ family response regulator